MSLFPLCGAGIKQTRSLPSGESQKGGVPAIESAHHFRGNDAPVHRGALQPPCPHGDHGAADPLHPQRLRPGLHPVGTRHLGLHARLRVRSAPGRLARRPDRTPQAVDRGHLRRRTGRHPGRPVPDLSADDRLSRPDGDLVRRLPPDSPAADLRIGQTGAPGKSRSACTISAAGPAIS